jgi:hypothetical protein
MFCELVYYFTTPVFKWHPEITQIIKEWTMTRIKDQIRMPESKMITYDPGNNVKFKIGFMKKAEFQRLIQKHTKLEFNTKTHQREENIHHDNLSREIFQTYVLGWEGVTHEWLSSKIPYETPTGTDPKASVEFSLDNLMDTIEAIYGMDAWLMEAIKNFDNFAEKRAEETKN